MDYEELKATLLELERRGWDSLCNSTGGIFYGDLMTADGIMVLANGAVMDRQSVVRSLEQAPPWRAYHISDARVIDTGPDSPTLIYVGTAYREDEHQAFVGVMSSVYVRHNDGWRLALYQQTPMPSPS